MRHKNSLELFSYWNTKRGDRPAPGRIDIDPADIRMLLPHVFICEAHDSGAMTFRLAGTALCALYGRELKAHSFGTLWLADAARNATRTGVAVATRAAPAVLSVDGLSRGGNVIQAEMLLLPVTGPTGQKDRLIGLMSVFDPPYWIGHDLLAGLSTTGIRFFDQSRDPIFLANRPEIELVTTPTSPIRVAGNRRQIGHLMVLEGGKRD